jgi:hypothetical protein
MTPLAYITMFTLPLVVLALFALNPPRRAVIYSFLWGWFFLPVRAFAVHGLSEYSKTSITPLSVLFAALIFDTNRVLALRPKIWDIPWLVFIISPFFSSMHNGLGPYDGANAVLTQFYFWGGGYLIGRIYFTDLEGLRELAFGFILGGLIYVPFCAFEAKMSPQLHLKLYGFAQTAFAQTRRLGGFRPLVFLQHGIALGVWMISSAMTAWWLWLCGTFTRRWKFSGGFWVLVLLATVVICRALEAAALMLAGMAVLIAVKYFRSIFRLAAIFILVAVPPVYTYVRYKEIWTGEAMVEWSAKINVERARSLDFRLKNEELLLDRGRESPTYGWGGWNRFQAKDAYGRNISVPDQEWIIAFGKNGLYGLISLQVTLLLPLLVLWKRVPIRYWSHPGTAPAAVLAVIVALHMWDCLLNAMVNPMFMMACGAITGMIPVTIKFRQAAVARAVTTITGPPRPGSVAMMR